MSIATIDYPSEAIASDGGRHYFLNVAFDRIASTDVVEMLDRADPAKPFRYVVTPNADHVVRLNREPALAGFYEAAWLTLCDSKPIALFARALSRPMPLVTGSDLTVSLFRSAIRRGDRIAIIAGNREIGEQVRARYPDVDFPIHVPPMGVLHDPRALNECVAFAVREKARFTFIAVGSPQSEKIAHLIAAQPDASGIGLCIGASLEFLVGAKKRAPQWMRALSLEWLHRMGSDPKRLWRRYVFGVAPLVGLFVKEMRGKRAPGRLASAGR